MILKEKGNWTGYKIPKATSVKVLQSKNIYVKTRNSLNLIICTVHNKWLSSANGERTKPEYKMRIYSLKHLRGLFFPAQYEIQQTVFSLLTDSYLSFSSN